MPRPKKPATPTALDVDAIHHPNEMRVNIPTNELRDFIGDEELMPPTLRYPRDPSRLCRKKRIVLEKRRIAFRNWKS